ncbi:MAG: hypothetical protein ACFFCW_23715 [Candidatus Hodarchaeota archaeon]
MTPQEDLWVYQPPSPNIGGRVLAGVLSLMFWLLFLFSLIQDAIDIPLIGYIIMIGFAVFLFWAASNIPAKIEIDRKQGTIKKRWQYFYFIRRVKSYNLSTFNTIKIIAGTAYQRFKPTYIVRLYGPTSAAVRPLAKQVVSAEDTFTILTITDEEKAKGYARDLADFLDFPVSVVSWNGRGFSESADSA